MFVSAEVEGQSRSSCSAGQPPAAAIFSSARRHRACRKVAVSISRSLSSSNREKSGETLRTRASSKQRGRPLASVLIKSFLISYFPLVLTTFSLPGSEGRWYLAQGYLGRAIRTPSMFSPYRGLNINPSPSQAGPLLTELPPPSFISDRNVVIKR